MTPRIRAIAIALVVATPPLSAQAPAKSLPQRIADDFIALYGLHPGYRINHAKGIVLTGTFTPSPGATALSVAPHLATTVPVIVRFSDAGGVPTIPDKSPYTTPRGIAIRFNLPGGAFTDIVANSTNGFPVGNGEDFAEFLEAVAATNKAPTPHPNPIEKFLGSHPRALAFVKTPKPMPVSFANEEWYGNNAFIFVNAKGVKQPGRYQIVPVDGKKYLDSAAAAKTPPNFLMDEIAKHVAKQPVQYKLTVQLANPGDPTSDGSIVWPDDRRIVELGTISITTVAPNNAALQKSLAFNPIYLTNGITLSDDQLPIIRSSVYALSVAHRR